MTNEETIEELKDILSIVLQLPHNPYVSHIHKRISHLIQDLSTNSESIDCISDGIGDMRC